MQFHQAEQQLREQWLHQKLTEWSGRIQDFHNYDDLIKSILDEMLQPLGFSCVWIYSAVDYDRYTMELVGAHGTVADFIKTHGQKLICYGDPMLMAVLETLEPVVVFDAETDPRTNKEAVKIFNNKTILNMQIRTFSELSSFIGMGTFGDEPNLALSDDDLKYVKEVGLLAGVTINRIRYQEKAADEEKERKRILQQLLQAQKMESIGQLTGGMAHDFNNILASMLGYAQLVQMKIKDGNDDKLKEYVHEILNAGERAKRLISQMLAFSKGGSSKKEEVDLQVVLRETLEMLKPAISSSIEICLEMNTEKFRVLVDPNLLQQVITNICINARDAIIGSGRVVLNIERFTDPEVYLCSSCHRAVSGKYIAINITDTGSGIENDKLSRIFEPFYTSKPTTKGTGMGLAMVHGIIHDAGGHILVKSTLGLGTTFTLLLQEIIDGNVARPTDITREGQEKRRRILIADRHESNMVFIKAILESEGYQALTLNCEKEVNVSAVLTDQYDLLIVDQDACSASWHNMLDVVSDANPEMRFVLLGNEYDRDLTMKTVKNRIVRFCHKPLNVNNLLADVAFCLQE